DGDDLIPLTSQGPNVVYGWANAIREIFSRNDGKDVCECEGIYWSKAMIYDVFEEGSEEEGYDSVRYMSIHGIDAVNIMQRNRVSLRFSKSDAWWFEVTLTHDELADTMRKVKVRVNTSPHGHYGQFGGGSSLGEWWVVDIQPAGGDSLAAIEKIHGMMF
ncbi:hypothetical protein BD410DRAFT_719692, partial [Rickenella mellea]